ncbi:MAG: ATP-binding protein, partial [Bacteroidetes bacterium]|nr:ATP-binding protein [Bacteroidota bacterium]
RRVGKTMLLNHLIKNDFPGKILSLNGEDQSVVSVLGNRTIENYKQLTSGYDYLVIDEAQKIPDIGNVLKLVVDHIEGLRVVVTGSSVFDLSNKLGEPLTGRKSTFYMFPLAQMEYSGSENLIETRARLEGRMIFGNYPELLQYSSDKDKAAYLNELVGSYLLKDILEYDGLRDSSKMLNLLRLIAFQIGKEVSLEELGRQLGLSRNTVEKHLDLLTKVFVIYKVSGFSRNLRSEVTKTSRWYFFDNGIRNALISNFNPLNLRNDTGELWENYLLSERIKFQQYTGMLSSNYFWRTYQQQEIDWIEDRSGMLHAFEIKWGTNKTFKPPSAWVNAYPDSTFEVITPDNYLLWIQSED